MLDNKQKQKLKGLANTLKIKYQIGKNEITDTLISMLDKALTAHELIKVDVMKSVTSEIMQIALDISSKLNADIVQILGRTILLYRKNEKNPKIII